jgi:hypothetical protein
MPLTIVVLHKQYAMHHGHESYQCNGITQHADGWKLYYGQRVAMWTTEDGGFQEKRCDNPVY